MCGGDPRVQGPPDISRKTQHITQLESFDEEEDEQKKFKEGQENLGQCPLSLNKALTMVL